jgi:hypothetical protein
MFANLKPGSYAKGRFIYFAVSLLLVLATYKLFGSSFTNITESTTGAANYFSLQSITANYPLVKNDSANSLFLKDQILAFEHEFPPAGAPIDLVNAYRIKYYDLLKKFELSSIASTIDPDIIFKVGEQVAPLIDSYYLDPKIFPRHNSTDSDPSQLYKVLRRNGIDTMKIKNNSETRSKTPGTLSIKGIVGGRALLVADCSQPDCTLAFNLTPNTGWHAYINGRASPLTNNNPTLTTTVSRGISRIWFVHEDWINLLGGLLSFTALLAFILFWQAELANQSAVR